MFPNVSLEEMNQIVIELKGDAATVHRLARLQLALAEWNIIGERLADFQCTLNEWVDDGHKANGLPSLLKKWPTTC